MRDREGRSIEAEKILVIIQTQTVVYLNSTEYRVLGVERAINASVIEPNAAQSKDTNALYIHTYIHTYMHIPTADCVYKCMAQYVRMYVCTLYTSSSTH